MMTQRELLQNARELFTQAQYRRIVQVLKQKGLPAATQLFETFESEYMEEASGYRGASALRKALIRLAHQNPGPLREAILPILKTAASPEQELTAYANQAFQLFRPDREDPRELSMDVIYAVIGMAKRKGLSQMEVLRWLQSAYGGVWVRNTNLNPGVDMKDLTRAVKQKMK